jgi:hypothetical protein
MSPSLSSARWKILVGVAGLALAALDLWGLVQWERFVVPSESGTLGAAFGAAATGHELPILAIEPRSPLAAAGAKVGDRVRLDHFADRARQVAAGERIGMTLVSAASARHVEVVAAPQADIAFHDKAAFFLFAGFSAMALAIAVLIGLREADRVSVRFFSIALLTIPEQFAHTALPAGAVQRFVDAVYPLAGFAFAYLFFVLFCFRYPDESPSPARARLRRAMPIYVAIALSMGGWGVAFNLGLVDPPYAAAAPRFAIASVALSFLGLALAWREALGTMRSRIAWIALSMGFVYLAYLGVNLLALLGLRSLIGAYSYIQAAAIFAGLSGLAYALLRHRIFDLGFALNRALVYAGVSTVLLVSFGLLEWLAHQLIHFENQAHNTLLDAALAIAVFLAFHKVRDATEHAVERVFFHAWQLRDAALRKFVKQAAYIVSPADLIHAFQEALARFTGGAACCIYLRRPDGAYEGQDESKAALAVDHGIAIALRAEPAALFLDPGTGSPDMELALPMAHRGELNGFTLLGRKADGSPYRPDEVELLAFAAHQVGLDLHALEIERLRRELAEVSAQARAYRSLIAAEMQSAE